MGPDLGIGGKQDVGAEVEGVPIHLDRTSVAADAILTRSYVCHALSPSSCSVCRGQPGEPGPENNVFIHGQRGAPRGTKPALVGCRRHPRSPSLIGSVMRCPERRLRRPDVRCANGSREPHDQGTIGISILGYAATSACSARMRANAANTTAVVDRDARARTATSAASSAAAKARIRHREEERATVARRSCRARRRTCARRWRRRSPRTRPDDGRCSRGRGARARRSAGGARGRAGFRTRGDAGRDSGL